MSLGLLWLMGQWRPVEEPSHDWQDVRVSASLAAYSRRERYDRERMIRMAGYGQKWEARWASRLTPFRVVR